MYKEIKPGIYKLDIKTLSEDSADWGNYVIDENDMNEIITQGTGMQNCQREIPNEVDFCEKFDCEKKHAKWYHKCCYCKNNYNPDYSIVRNGACRPCGNKKSNESRERNRKEINIRRKIRRIENPEYYKKKNKERIERRKINTLKAYGGDNPSCVCCGETILDFLCLDHINNDGKIDRIKHGTSNFYDGLKKRGYPKGLQILCFNCNMGKQFCGICPHKFNKLKSGKLVEELITYHRLNNHLSFWELIRNWSGAVDIYLKDKNGIMKNVLEISGKDE